MATTADNVGKKTSPVKKIVEKPAETVDQVENGKQDECATNGKAMSPEKTPKEVQPEINGAENGKHAEDADAEKPEDNAETEESAEKEEQQEEESPEEPEVQEVTNGTSHASQKSPVKISPLKKKAVDAGDNADEPDTKKLRRSLDKPGQEVDNGAPDTTEDATNAKVVEATD